MAKEIVVGLDIGTTKICAIVGEVGDSVPGKVNIVGLGQRPSNGVRKGVIVDIEASAAAIRGAVDDASRRTGYEINTVVVGVTGQHIASLNSRGTVAITSSSREVTQHDVDRVNENARVIVLPPDREIIHSIPRSYIIDGQEGITHPVGMSGTRLEVESHIVTGSVTFLQNVAKAVHMAGLSLEATVLEPIATGEAVLSDSERELGVALADIGGGTTDIAVYVGGDVIYSGVVPIGGTHVTKDISIGLRSAEAEAERVKLRYGAARAADVGSDRTDLFEIHSLTDHHTRTYPRKILTEIITPRMEELFEFVQQELEKSGYYTMLPAGLVLSGGGSQMVGGRELCEQIVQLPTRVGVPRETVGLPLAVRSGVYATGVGLVLYGARNLDTQPTSGMNGVAAAAFSESSRHLQTFTGKWQAFISKILGG